MIEIQKRIEDIIWTELDRQFQIGRFGPYVNRRSNIIDGRVDINAVAVAVEAGPGLDAVVRRLEENAEVNHPQSIGLLRMLGVEPYVSWESGL